MPRSKYLLVKYHSSSFGMLLLMLLGYSFCLPVLSSWSLIKTGLGLSAAMQVTLYSIDSTPYYSQEIDP